MQGDYMILNYEIERQARINLKTRNKLKNGLLVLKKNKNGVVDFVRFYKDESLNSEEFLFPYQQRYYRVLIQPKSFFFQEGHAKYYNVAEYAVLKIDGFGKSVLIGLADKNKVLISPK